MNNTPIAQVLKEYTHLVHSRGLEYMNEGSAWKPIVGTLALGDGIAEKDLMQSFQRDKSEDKIDNINSITEIAELVCQTDDFSQDNMFGFSYTIRQLNTYAHNDEDATQSLQRIKDLFYTFASKLYYSFDESGKEVEASAILNHLGEKILIDDDELRSKLKVLWTGETAPSYSKSSRGCYIATVVYSSPFAKEVIAFKNYRDQVLKKSMIGIFLLKIYYSFSPTLSKYLRNKVHVNCLIKNMLLDPLYRKMIASKDR